MLDAADLVGEVRVSTNLAHLWVVPRDPNAGRALWTALREATVSPGLKRTAQGIAIPLAAAAALRVIPTLVWSPEADRWLENRTRAQSAHPEILAKIRELRAGGLSVANPILPAGNELDKLDDHQKVNVAAMTLPDSFGACVFDEQGAGKTVTFIFAFDILVDRREADAALIVAPTSMISEWQKDIRRFMGDLYQVALLAGNRKDKSSALTSGAEILICNFETVVSMEAEIRALLRRRPGRTVLCVDESFFVKTPEAHRTRAVRRLREWCGRAFVLCGTPAPNTPHDLIEQFNIVDFGMTFSGVKIPDDRAAVLPIVQRVIEERGVYLRHLKKDVLPNLPQKAFRRILVQMGPQQKRLYEGALRNLIVDLQSTDDTSFRDRLQSFLARRSALLQICSAPASIAPDCAETPCKLMALDQIVDELVMRQREKLVIWSFYTASVEAITQRYFEFGAVRYDGTITDIAERREAIERFQEDDKTMIFVGNPAAAGAGLTLHRARLAVYESMSNQAAHYLQSLDRIHRRGQDRPVEYLVLLCEGTLEVTEYQRLLQKEQAAQSLLGDQIDLPVTREVMLDEALNALAMIETTASGN